ncbi:hypothetical protein BC830DRAFT_1209873 [Chytriomyces sp. MP71]|nr:hypothetical protein BC830DRAFT_1209873 [Chytriomyces sp. MP71]
MSLSSSTAYLHFPVPNAHKLPPVINANSQGVVFGQKGTVNDLMLEDDFLQATDQVLFPSRSADTTPLLMQEQVCGAAASPHLPISFADAKIVSMPVHPTPPLSPQKNMERAVQILVPLRRRLAYAAFKAQHGLEMETVAVVKEWIEERFNQLPASKKRKAPERAKRMYGICLDMNGVPVTASLKPPFIAGSEGIGHSIWVSTKGVKAKFNVEEAVGECGSSKKARTTILGIGKSKLSSTPKPIVGNKLSGNTFTQLLRSIPKKEQNARVSSLSSVSVHQRAPSELLNANNALTSQSANQPYSWPSVFLPLRQTSQHLELPIPSQSSDNHDWRMYRQAVQAHCQQPQRVMNQVQPLSSSTVLLPEPQRMMSIPILSNNHQEKIVPRQLNATMAFQASYPFMTSNGHAPSGVSQHLPRLLDARANPSHHAKFSPTPEVAQHSRVLGYPSYPQTRGSSDLQQQARQYQEAVPNSSSSSMYQFMGVHAQQAPLQSQTFPLQQTLPPFPLQNWSTAIEGYGSSSGRILFPSSLKT